MPKKRFTAEEIIRKLREAEVLLSQGQAIDLVCRGLGISEQTYYRWRKEYGGLRTDQARRLKDLERENVRLKKVVADLVLDKAMLQEALSVRSVPMHSMGARPHDAGASPTSARCSAFRSDVRAG
jgi:putative transposase